MHLDALEVAKQPGVERRREARLPVQEEAQALATRDQWLPGVGRLEAQTNRRMSRLRLVEDDLFELERQQVDLLRGPKLAGGALHGLAGDSGTACDLVNPTQCLEGGVVLDDRTRRDRPQIVGQQQLQEAVDDVRRGIVDPLSNPSGQEGEAFEQTLDVGIAALLRQQPGRRRMNQGEFPAHLAQIGELALVVLGAHGSTLPEQSTAVGGTICDEDRALQSTVTRPEDSTCVSTRTVPRR
jgi:hypothetical protein